MEETQVQGVLSKALDARIDLLLLPSLPFGPWLAGSPTFDRDAAIQSLAMHDRGLMAIARANAAAGVTLVSSRPMFGGLRIFNTAVKMQANGTIEKVHDGQVFANEEGWHEGDHFLPGPDRHGRFEHGGWKVATLVGAELTFPELARAHGRAGAGLILVPRSTGGDPGSWLLFLRTAALVSGAYCASANKTGDPFTGGSVIVAPNGEVLGETTPDQPMIVADLDLDVVLGAKRQVPASLAGSPGTSNALQW